MTAQGNGRLQLDPGNARKHSPRNKALIRQSLEATGAGRSILADADGIIRAGNGVFTEWGDRPVKVVESDGHELVVVKRTDLSGKAAVRAAMLDNLAADSSYADYDADILAGIVSDDELIATLAREDKAIAALLAKAEPQAEKVDAGELIDKAAELQKKWQVARGDVWECGKHRLMCGDSTNGQDISRLMQSRRAQMMWTDPPYGVEYEGKTKAALTIQNDGADELALLLHSVFAYADIALDDGAAIYVAHPPGALQVRFLNAFIETNWKLHEQLIWLKNSMVLGHSDYHYKHEPIIYGWKGKNRQWYGGRDEVSVIAVDRPSRSELHPTMKPPALVEVCLKNSSKYGDILLDPFLGSGTTLVACEQTGRIGRGMEIEPKYCAVSLERLSNLGLTPRRVQLEMQDD